MKQLFILLFATISIVSCKKDSSVSPQPLTNPNEAKILGQWNVTSLKNNYTSNGNPTMTTNITGQSDEYFKFTTINGAKALIINLKQDYYKKWSGEYTYTFFGKDALNRDIIKLESANGGSFYGYNLYTIKELTATSLILYSYIKYTSGSIDETTIQFQKAP